MAPMASRWLRAPGREAETNIIEGAGGGHILNVAGDCETHSAETHPAQGVFGFPGWGGIFDSGPGAAVFLTSTASCFCRTPSSPATPMFWVKSPSDCTGLVTSLGNNLIGNPTFTGCTITLQPTDLTGDPGLGTFTDNGTPGNGH